MGEATLKKALRRARRELGDDHAETLEHMDTYAEYLRKMGCYGEAEPLYREALSARRRTLGDEHPDTLASINNLALLLSEQGKLGEAEPLYREALSAHFAHAWGRAP
jgi:hypothetical protein